MKIAQELFIHRGAGRVLCDDGDDLCTRVIGGVRGLQVDSSLDVRVWSLIASKTRNELKSGLYSSRDLTAFISGSLQKKEPRIYLRHQRICIWVRASVPCVSSLTTQSKFTRVMIKFGMGMALHQGIYLCAHLRLELEEVILHAFDIGNDRNASLVYVFLFWGVPNFAWRNLHTKKVHIDVLPFQYFGYENAVIHPLLQWGHSTVKEIPVDPFFFVTLGSPYDSYSSSSFLPLLLLSISLL